MMKNTARRLSPIVAALFVLGATGCASQGGTATTDAGEGWTPDPNVTLVVPFGPGGGSDAVGRVIAAAVEEVEPDLTVTVENREGGSGAVGFEYVKSRQGDAQTLLSASTMLAIPDSPFAGFTYDDYTPLALVAEDPASIVAAADAPFESCDEVVQAATKGRVIAGITGEYTLDGVSLQLFSEAAGVGIDNVVFESGGEILAGLLGGQVDIGFLNPGEVAGQLESGDLKALCTLGSEQYPYELLEGTPTAQEAGIDVALAQFRGVVAPPGISEEQRDYWAEVLERAVDTEVFQGYVESNLVVPSYAGGDEFVDYLREQYATLDEATK